MFIINTNGKKLHTNGGNLLSVLRENGIFADSPCGGRGKCGKCTVYIDGVRALACQTEVDRDMTVTFAYADSGAIEKYGKQRRTVKCGDSGLGIAVDIGTTTIAAYLVDLSDGSVIKTEARLNPQKAYGADVMSRIDYCVKNGTDELCALIRNEIDDISRTLEKDADIKRMVIAANTVMSHIYMNADVSGLARTPFKPAFLDLQKLGKTTLMPCVSAYIGGDIISSALACDMDSEERTVMLLDLGTNGEIVLLHNDIYYCCSTSAGPALEGAGISCGMGSVDGAVCGFEFINSIPSIKTINQKPAIGICGSGIIDVVAELLKNEMIDKYGTFKDKRCIQPKLSVYLGENGLRINGDIYITQKDIREFQTVKSAIYSGINLLMQAACVTAKDICEVYLCGGLGSNINIKNACDTGLLPREFLGKTTVCGNTSGNGAVAAVCDMSVIGMSEKIKNTAKIIELGGSAEFEKLFMENLNFNK